MDHLARKTSISLTTRPKALKDVSITNTFTISLSSCSSSMQACKAKESLLQEHLLLGLLRASYYQNFSILAAWQTLQHWWQQTANQSRRRQPHKKCVDKWKRAKAVFLTLHFLKLLRRAARQEGRRRRRGRRRALFLNASRDMDIFHILYHCKAALKNEGEQRQKVHNCLAKRKLADRVFFSSLRSWRRRQVVLLLPRPSSSLPHTLFFVLLHPFWTRCRCCAAMSKLQFFHLTTMHSFFSQETIAPKRACCSRH